MHQMSNSCIIRPYTLALIDRMLRVLFGVILDFQSVNLGVKKKSQGIGYPWNLLNRKDADA